MDHAKALELYAKLVATNPRLTLKGDTMPYTSLNGHMISVLHKDGSVALRLPPDARAPFLAKYKTKLANQYGVVQPEYVMVPDRLLAKTAELKSFLAQSYDYVASMKPKATTKPRKPAAKGRRKKS
jgi:hypothetical protein